MAGPVNIMTGEMSSSARARHCRKNEYGAHIGRRLAAKPGIAGLWQVADRFALCQDNAVQGRVLTRRTDRERIH